MKRSIITFSLLILGIINCISQCPNPGVENVKCSNVYANNVNISWDYNSSSADYIIGIVKCSNGGYDCPTQWRTKYYTTAKYYNITGLEANSWYRIFVAVCCDETCKTFGSSMSYLLFQTNDKVNTSIEETANNIKLQFFPNPSSERFMINNPGKEHLKLSIFNLVGELIMEKKLVNENNQIDISDLTRGIYIIKATGNNSTFQQKLIKE